MLLSNSGLMEQLQTLLSPSSSSAPSLSPSACPPSALLCCSHLLLSSLITLQRLHPAQVHAAAQFCSYQDYRIEVSTVKGGERGRLCGALIWMWVCLIYNISQKAMVLETMHSAPCAHCEDYTVLLAIRYLVLILFFLLPPSFSSLFSFSII